MRRMPCGCTAGLMMTMGRAAARLAAGCMPQQQQWQQHLQDTK